MTEADLGSGIVIILGVMVLGVGALAAAGRLHDATRAHRKTAALSNTMPEGWSSWFLDGFSGVSIGLRYLRVTLLLVSWAAAGLCLIALGLSLWGRA